MKSSILAAALAVAATAMTGCATVTTFSTQTVKISTEQGKSEVSGARCILKNDKGEWMVNSTPGTATIAKSYDPLVIRCNKADTPEGIHTVDSRARGVYGNALVLGWIGVMVDAKTGKGYNYPDEMTVQMGKNTQE